MKKLLTCFSLLFFCCVMVVKAQEAATQRNLSTYEPGKRAQGVYFEVFGPGVTYSFNYDTRFQSTLNGLGGRVGLSYLSADGNGLFTLPIQFNYLLGKNGRYFEMGLGATYLGFNGSSDENDILFVDNSQVIGTMVFGYRRQPVDGGFMFRVGISPVFGQGNFLPYWPYLSFGYSF